MRVAVHCERRRCGEALTFKGFDRIGNAILDCESCEKNRQGRCRRCPTGRLTPHPCGGYGSGKYCRPCKRAVDNARNRADRERRNARSRRWRARNRAYVNQRARNWRQAHPRDQLDRLYDSSKGKRRRQDPAKREHDLKRQRAGHRRRMQDPVWVEKERARGRARYHAKREHTQQAALAA